MQTKRIDLNAMSVTLDKLLEQLEPGVEIILTRGEEPMARLMSMDVSSEESPRVFGLHQGEAWISDDFTDELPDEFWLGEE